MKQGKRFLALLLALSMTVGLTCPAAWAAKEPTEAGYAEIQLTAGTLIDPLEYNGTSYDNLTMYVSGVGMGTSTTPATMAQAIDQVFINTTTTDADGNQVVKATPGETIYFAVKLKDAGLSSSSATTANGEAINGLMGFNAYYDYDADAFALGDVQLHFANIASMNAFINDTSYKGGYTASAAQLPGNDSTYMSLVFAIEQSSALYVPQTIGWDFLVPITVNNDTAPGDYTFSFYEGSIGANTYGVASGHGENGSAEKNNGNVETKNIKANDLTIRVVNPSDPLAGQGTTQYDGSFVNNKNIFFDSSVTENGNGDDYFIVPEVTLGADETTNPDEVSETVHLVTTFAEGDKLVVYANAVDSDTNEDIPGEEQGAVLIQKDADGSVTGTGVANTLYANLKVTVPPETEGGEETTKYLLPQAGGKVWIDVIKATAEGEAPKTASEQPIQLTAPAEKLYYSGDTVEYPVYAAADLGGKDNPVEVPYNSTVQDVLSQLTSKPAVITGVALDYGGETVNISLDWTEIEYTVPTTLAAGEEATPDFTSHDANAKLLIPFPGDGEGEGGYAQGGADKATRYCAVVYATVLPIAGDYTVKAGDGSDPATLVLSGDSFAGVANGDAIKVYKNSDKTGDSATVTVGTTTDTDSETTTGTYTLDGLTGLTAGDTVYVTYTENGGSETKAVSVTVSDSAGTPEVSDNLSLSPDGNAIPVEAGKTLDEVLALTDEEGNGIFSGVKVPVSGGRTVTVSVPNTVELYSDAEMTTTATFTNGTGDTLYMKYVIPTGTTDATEAEPDGVAFANSKNFAITATITFLTKIKPQATNAQGTNNAYPADDVVTFTQAATGDEAVKATDTVTFYSDAECTKQLAAVTGSADAGSPVSVDDTTHVVTVTVPQLGYNAGTVYMVIGRASGTAATIPSDPIAVTIGDEPYTITKITPMSDSTMKLPATLDEGNQEITTWDEIYAQLPSETTVTYGRFKKSATDNSTVLDAATTGSMTVPFTPWTEGGKNWVREDNGGDVTDNNVRSMGTTPLKIKAQVKVDGLKVGEIPAVIVNNSAIVTADDVATTLELQILVTTAAQDEANAAAKLARLSVTNNAYPTADRVSFTVDTPETEENPNLAIGDTIRIFASNPDAEGFAGSELASHAITSADINNKYFEIEQLGYAKSALYFTIESATSPRSAARSLSMDEEPWVLYSYALDPNAVSVTATTTAADFDTLTGTTLPQSMTVTVAHLVTTGTTLSAAKTAATSATLNASGWTVGDAGDALALSHLANPTGDTPLVLHPALPDGALDTLMVGTTAVVSSTEVTPTMPTLALTVNTDATLSVPTFGSVNTDPDYVVVTNEKGNNDDAITIGVTEADFNPTLGDGVTVTLTYLDRNGDKQTITPVDLVTTNPLTVDTTDPAFTGLTPADAVGGVTLTFAKDGYNSVTRTVDIAAEPSVTTIAEVTSPRKLSLLTGTVSANSELTDMVKDITTVTVKSDGGESISGVPLTSAGWKLQQSTDGTNWTDVATASEGWATALSTVTAGTSYRMTAALDITNEVDGNTLDNPDSIPAVIPVTLNDSSSEEGQNANGLRLSVGNSDLYHHFDSTNAALVTAKGDTTKASHRNDLVFYYLWESYELDVKKYMEPTDGDYSAMFDGIVDAEGNFVEWATWRASHPDATITVKEIPLDGGQLYSSGYKKVGSGADAKFEAVTHGAAHIEPTHSSKGGDYIAINAENGIKRNTETYRVIYTVTDGANVYTAYRIVKLRYFNGDTNLDGMINITDGNNVYSSLANKWDIKSSTLTQDQISALKRQILDINSSGKIDINDGSAIFNRLSGKLNGEGNVTVFYRY